MAIQGFANPVVRTFFETGSLRRSVSWASASKVVSRKLDMIDYARELRDLASPPGNRLKALRGAWTGFHSIRVNDQFRIIFRWSQDGAEDVDVIDYH